MRNLFIAFFIIGFFSCQKQEVESSFLPQNEDPEWSIPKSEVRDGGVGRDGIPSIDNPTYISARDQEVLFDHEMITGIVINGQAVAFPHKILDYHEVVNTKHAGFSYALTFCPLTGTSLVFPREIQGVETTFGVSGLLFNSNLIVYDRNSESLWSQMLHKGVRGEHKDQEKDFYQLIETTWSTWKQWYPESLVLQAPNGRPRSYDEYAYGGYRTNHDLVLFPPKYDFTKYPRKERLLGIVLKKQMFYVRFNEFEFKNFLKLKIGSENALVFGSEKDNFMFAYLNKTVNGEEVEVQKVLLNESNNQLFKDNQGNIWSIEGQVLSGPNVGERLQTIRNYVGYSFAMAAFYQNDFFDKNAI